MASHSASTRIPSRGVVFDPESGVFTWTPNEDQGPGTYQFTVRASDPQNYGDVDDTETFTVNVTEENLAPTLDAIADLTCRRGRTVSTTITAVDADVPPDNLTFSIDAGDAQGACIDPVTGELTWNIPWWQPTGKYDISVTVTDDSAASGRDTATFSVIVNELGDELVMMPILNYIVPAGVPVAFNTALRKRGPATGVVTYSLSPDSPADAVISPSGHFSWTPGTDSSGNVFEITILAHDQAQLPLETSETFRIFVQMPYTTSLSTQYATPLTTPCGTSLSAAKGVEGVVATVATVDPIWGQNPHALRCAQGRATQPATPLLQDLAIVELTSQTIPQSSAFYTPSALWRDLLWDSSTKSGANNEKEATKSLIMELMQTGQ